jgi:hypothetical protein
MVRLRMRWGALALASAALLSIGCSEDVEPNPRLRVSVFGWGPAEAGAANTFVQGMPQYNGATTVRVAVTDPGRDRILGQESSALASRKLALPDTGFGAGLRLELEVLDENSQVLASGSTPRFTVAGDTNSRAMRMLITPTNAFAPIGSLVVTSEGVREFQPSRLDYRAECARQNGCSGVWLGRVGHAVAPTSDGKVLIIGGAEEIPGSALGAIPNIKRLYADVQIFDPETGYFSDLSLDESTQQPRPDDQDLLSEPRAWGTVTALGNDRFLVVGGYTKLGEESYPLDTVELIDLKAAPGERVKLLTGDDGNLLKLTTARGFHTAVYRPESDQVVIMGGVGADASQILDSVELVDLRTNRIISNAQIKLGTPRTGHASLKLDDGSIWVIGGRSDQSALATSEILKFSDSAITSTPGPTLKEARFDFGATQVGESDTVLVVGGYTSLSGAVTGSYELGLRARPNFETFINASLGSPRGGLNLIRLPQSGDVVVFGGRDMQGTTVERAERLLFKGLGLGAPYEVISDDLGIMHVKRYGAAAAMMTNGRILIVGGLGVDTTQQATVSLDNAELYNARDPVAGGVMIP